MFSKNHKSKTKGEQQHLAAVASLPCSVCQAPPPSQCHHIKQQRHYTVVALCPDCHSNWHGTKTLWKVRKMDEIDALNETIRMLNELA
jgi:hypothetical protein